MQFREIVQAVGLKAVVELKALAEDGSPMDGPRGILTLEQHPEGVRVMGTIAGLSPGLHGFHVHEKGDLRKGCNSAGPHFNPYMVTQLFTLQIRDSFDTDSQSAARMNYFSISRGCNISYVSFR